MAFRPQRTSIISSLQGGLGIDMKDDRLSGRRMLRRIQFGMMAAFVIALAVHVATNAFQGRKLRALRNRPLL